jgi:methylated-DNA-[protein]-cysteine S-methyltransferase
MLMRHRIIRTFTGPFVLMQAADASLRTSWLNRETESLLKNSREDRSLLPDLADRIRRYFDGETDVDFSDIPLVCGGEFHRRCWRACRRIPRGQVRSYAQLAAAAGSPAAARAAGQAMRNNPLPIITPCHRVVGSTGLLHGFGGTTNQRSKPLDIKRALLEMEGWAHIRKVSRMGTSALTDDVLPGLSERAARTLTVAAS